VVILILAAISIALIVLTRGYRLHRVPRRPEPMSPVVSIALLVGMLLLGKIGMLLGLAIFGIDLPTDVAGASPLRDAVRLRFCDYAAQMIGLVAFIILRRAARQPLPDMRAPLPRAMAIGAAALLLVWPLVFATAMLAGWMTGANDRIAHDTLRQLADGPIDRWQAMMMLLVLFVTPVIEEVMYRGLLQDAIAHATRRRWLSIIIASAIFGFMHAGVADPHALLALFVLGLGLGWAYEKTGRLTAPIVMHALFNAGNLLLARGISA
jgi:membrane protease YdiL (CAAX protease family)